MKINRRKQPLIAFKTYFFCVLSWGMLQVVEVVSLTITQISGIVHNIIMIPSGDRTVKKAKIATIEEVKLIAETLDAESALLRVREILTARGELSEGCYSMHSTRKASATVVYHSTGDAIQTMKFLNHTKLETTLHYIEPDDGEDDALTILDGVSL